MSSGDLHSRSPKQILQEVFGYPDFRVGQQVATTSAVAGEDVVVLLPTGGGKSLCYQVPAISFAERGYGTTVVVSPLIALMNDQVDALRARGVAAGAIHSQQEEETQRDVFRQFVRGELTILYVSPERATLDSFKDLLTRAPIAMLAIDEAHCLSQWGHDFRPAYLKLNELRGVIDAPTMALTATATRQVLDEIVQTLRLRSPEMVVGDFSRPNLSFSVRHERTESVRIEQVMRLLTNAGFRDVPDCGRAMIYCSTRKKTETVAKALRSAGFAVGYYHAGRTADERARIQRAFSSKRLRVLVATNAFGMGIDYPDVRFSIHFQTPGSLAAYYQEAGRAGRDGAPSQCVLFFGPGDMMTQRRLGGGGNGVTAARKSAQLVSMERYAHAERCRQAVICEHFTGEEVTKVCGLCDVCRGEVSVPDEDSRPAPVASLSDNDKQLILSAADNLRRPVGKTNLAKALRGSRAKTVLKLGLEKLPEFGELSHHTERSLCAAIDELVSQGELVRKGMKYPTVWPAGKPVRRDSARQRDVPPKKIRTKLPESHYHSSARAFSDIRRELDNFRKRTARRLKWKPYMVFQKKVIVALENRLPETEDELLTIPGMGPARVERFGQEILEIIRRFR